MMFVDCPAYLDPCGAVRCGLPAVVRYRFTMRSSEGPLESVMIRCPAGHQFNGPIEFLTCENRQKRDPGVVSSASHDSFSGSPDGRGGSAASASNEMRMVTASALVRPLPGQSGIRPGSRRMARLSRWSIS